MTDEFTPSLRGREQHLSSSTRSRGVPRRDTATFANLYEGRGETLHGLEHAENSRGSSETQRTVEFPLSPWLPTRTSSVFSRPARSPVGCLGD
jgi:hypothetical protein